jgi:hypothetical protein
MEEDQRLAKLLRRFLRKKKMKRDQLIGGGMITGMKDGKWRERTIIGVRGFVSLFPFD